MPEEVNMLTRLGNLIDKLIHRQQLLEERVNNVEQWTKQISENMVNTQENSCYQPIVNDLDDNNPPKGKDI